MLLLSLMLSGCVHASDEPPIFTGELLQTFVAISRHDKTTGERVAEWAGRAEGDPLIHLDSLMEHEGRLYASHSNYPVTPMTSSVEIWDAATMEHVATHSFGIYRGSLTWLD